MQIYPHVAFLYHTQSVLRVCVVVKSSYYVVFSLTSASNQCGAATTARRIINSGTKWRMFFFRERHRLLQKMIEGCSLLINTIPEFMEHTKLLTWLFPSLLHLAQSWSPPATTIPALERSRAGAFAEMQPQ